MNKKTVEKIKKYYKNDPESFTRAQISFSLIKNENKNKKILDVGCGYGELLNLLKKENFNYLYEADMPKDCLAKCKKLDIKNIKRINLDEENLPFPKKVFDLIVMTEVFEHLFYLNRVIKEIKRVLKKRGLVLFSFPNELNIMVRLRILFGEGIHNPTAVGANIRFFKLTTIRLFLEKNGFEIKKMWEALYWKKIYKLYLETSFLTNRFPSVLLEKYILKRLKND